MAREQVEAGSKEQVLTALGTAAGQPARAAGRVARSRSPSSTCRCRGRRRRRSRRCTPTRWRSTRAQRVDRRSSAIPHLQRAIELDPDFALALAALSGVYANTSQTALAPVYSKRAFDLRDRVSERERYYHLVALLPRRAAGLGQGARPGAGVDGRLPARSVRLQRARPGRGVPRPAERGRDGTAQGDRARPALPAAEGQPGGQPAAPEQARGGEGTRDRRDRRRHRLSAALSRGVPRRPARGRRRRDGEVPGRRPQDARRARHRQLGRARGGVPRAARSRARRRQRRAAAGPAAQFQGVGGPLHHRGRRDSRHRRPLRRGPAPGAGGARVEPRQRYARYRCPRPRLVRRRPGARADA